MKIFTDFLTGFASALLGALGMGGGGILLIYLTVFAGVEQLNAQGMNLIFFLPVAAVALIFHSKNKLVDWKITAFTISGGLAGVFLGKFAADFLGGEFLRKAFGLFLLVLGLKELFKKENPAAQKL
ncbi:MAG: sulfite exporter TauE/SafE family protein [Oscillospiraceae bacterium]|jgi:uncharacterized membrane protein YfcA|nr:sulfite exporter TauE/SafE family protein [Oscillospiraceae bacterium]